MEMKYEYGKKVFIFNLMLICKNWKWVVIGIVLGFLLSCNNVTIVQPNQTVSLVYSGTYLIGSHRLYWPEGQSGMLVFNVVRNVSDEVWSGTPRAAVYDSNTLLKIGEGEGVLTSHINKDIMVPEMPYKTQIQPHSELETLIYLNINFDQHPLVYIYWQFVPLGAEITFPDSVNNIIPLRLQKVYHLKITVLSANLSNMTMRW